MFKINKTTKYIILALSFAFVFFVGSVNTASAGGSNSWYMGVGWDDYTDFTYGSNSSYSYPSSYSYDPGYTYTYDYSDYNHYYPSYYYDNYSYGYDYSCSSCGYSYQSMPQVVYVPNTSTCTSSCCGSSCNTNPTPTTLEASCVISPNSINVGDSVTMSASASGGTGSYQYYWSGSDGISGSSQVITGRFTSYGNKTVSLTVTSGSQTVTRTCSAYVNQPYRYYDYNYYYNGNYNYNNLTATCSANPSNANVGDNVIWTVYPNGGNGAYSYSWTGTDGLSYGNAYQIQQRYSTAGTKTATVTVYTTGGQTVTATCNTNIAGTVSSGTPISGIYLNEVPATGIDFNLKVALYTLGLVIWSAFVAFMIINKKKAKLAMANRTRIEDFKLENMKRKNLI